MDNKPRKRTRHIASNANVSKIEKKEALNIEAVGKTAKGIGNLIAKLKGKKQWEEEIKVVYLKLLFLY